MLCFDIEEWKNKVKRRTQKISFTLIKSTKKLILFFLFWSLFFLISLCCLFLLLCSVFNWRLKISQYPRALHKLRCSMNSSDVVGFDSCTKVNFLSNLFSKAFIALAKISKRFVHKIIWREKSAQTISSFSLSLLTSSIWWTSWRERAKK